MPQPVVKAGAQAIRSEALARILTATVPLQQGKTNDVAAWRTEVQGILKSAHLAAAALARGGWAEMRPADYQTVEPVIARQFEYLEGFAQDVAKGRYGSPGKPLRLAVMSRAAQYSGAALATYENTRTQAGADAGHNEARRVLGASDHCESCKVWAALGWIPLEEMQQKYPIGSGKCGSRCNCQLETRRGGEG